MTNVIGSLGAPSRSRVDGRGRLEVDDLAVDWWIGGDDRWHIPSEDPGVRQVRVGAAPVYETRARVPAGDAVQRAYATGGPGAPVVLEVENDSPAPFAIAFVVHVAKGQVALDGTVLRVDRAPRLTLSHAPRFWAAGANVREIVTRGEARADGPVSWRAPVTLAVLLPVAHRTSVRLVVAGVPVDPREVAGAEATALGWARQLDRGMRTELPDELQAQIDAARADLLLAPAEPRVAAALEDWGFDVEFEQVWAHLGFLAKRAARTRATRDPAVTHDPWAAASGATGIALLEAVHAVLVKEGPDHVDVLPGFPDEWRGVNLAVQDIPLRSGGTLSYALRWHGEHPALLWDAPEGVELRAPVLGREWHAAGGAGETLLS